MSAAGWPELFALISSAAYSVTLVVLAAGMIVAGGVMITLLR